MMDWFKTITPFITLIIGFFLSSLTGFFQGRKQDRRKVKKLLYHLLELRHQLQQETSITQGLLGIRPRLIQMLESETGEEININEDEFLSMIIPMFKDGKTEDRLEQLSKTVDMVLQELAEIEPLLAYELTGKYSIKDRLSHLGNLGDFGEMPFDIGAWMKPLLKDDLGKELDRTILLISRKVSKKTWKSTRVQLETVQEVDDEKLKDLVARIIKKMHQVLGESEPVG
ncbi:hypothetical protein SRABI27_03696 [Pedobacter sp. Bi27]|uniref:hypothetical protein n=1 Tax=Pedobacter sp. Bi27 TaxID=2822351 RepID=UPI001D71CEB2|nr:hypothetical protein [Pedobacter sp. Bi27]CAH0278217.1 hypothetical protein SRABI27_03696 [Pedobacter sp. Bi27]